MPNNKSKLKMIKKRYVPFVPSSENDVLCAEVTTIFLFANFQYIATMFAISVGKPFRLPFYTNSSFFNFFLLFFL